MVTDDRETSLAEVVPVAAQSLSRKPAAPQAGRYIPILDGWRGVAILFVLIFHGTYNTHFVPNSRMMHVSAIVGKLGILGVLIFFAISGYLITKKLMDETPAGSPIDLRAFFIKRVFRILPPLAVYLVVLLVLSLLGFITLARGDWSAPFFLSNYIRGTWYTSHFWSLSVEEHFYLFWPLCILIVGWRRSFSVGIVLVVAVGVYRALTMRHFAEPVQAAGLLQHTEMRIDYIMMGCLIALAVALHPSVKRYLAWFGSSVGFVILCLLLLLLTRAVRADLRSVQALLIALLVCGSSLANATLPRLLLANPAIRFIGKISYSLYIWQQLFLQDYTNPSLQSIKVLPAKYACAFAAAMLSYYLVERPAIKYGRRLLRRT